MHIFELRGATWFFLWIFMEKLNRLIEQLVRWLRKPPLFRSGPMRWGYLVPTDLVWRLSSCYCQGVSDTIVLT